MTWIVTAPGQLHQAIYATSTSNTDTNVGPGSTEDWIEEQQSERIELTKGLDGEVLKLETGLLAVLQQGHPARVLVPSGRQVALTKYVHETSHHQGWKKTLAALRRSYVWPGMSSCVKRTVQSCACALVKARVNHAHGMFSSRVYEGPRVASATP